MSESYIWQATELITSRVSREKALRLIALGETVWGSLEPSPGRGSKVVRNQHADRMHKAMAARGKARRED